MLPVVHALRSSLAPRFLHACAVCFGQADNADIGRAYGFGIVIMLGFTFLILGALGIAIYRIEAGRNHRPSPPKSPARLGGSPVWAP